METGFEVDAKDGAGRIGRFHVGGSTVTTPALLPVLHPRHRVISRELLEELGIEIAIGNAYSLYRSEELGSRAEEEGVHTVLGFDGVVMTDSGTFQAHVYGDVDVTNEEILRYQARIGSDVATILDVFSEPEDDADTAREGVETTTRRAERAVDLYASLEDEEEDDVLPGLTLPIQGGVHAELRTEAGRRMDALPGALYPIGGVVPLMERQRFLDLARVIAAAKAGLGAHRPVHLFGCGHPSILPLATLLGCDLYDSASYAKYAADGRYMTAEGTLHLRDLLDHGELPCPCPVCSGRSPRQLRDAHRDADDGPDPLAEHNLRVLVDEMRRVRTAIRRGRLFELALSRARTHPRLLDAVRILRDDRDRLLALDPVTKPTGLKWTGRETPHRPEAVRYRERLATRFVPWVRDRVDVVVEVPWSDALATGRAGPYADPDRGLSHDKARELTARGALLVYATPLAPVPWLLHGYYPAGQAVQPRETDPTGAEEMVQRTRRLVERLAPDHHRVWSGPGTEEDVGKILDDASPTQWAPVVDPGADVREQADRAVLAATVATQLGPEAVDPLLGTDPDALELGRSSNTGRVRTVHVAGDHVASLRAEVGHLTLRPPGARRLHAGLPAPRLRVPVTGDSVPYNRDGRSVFAGFVRTGDDLFDAGLAAGEECLVVDADDRLVAVGRTRLSAHEMARFERGVAVRVHEGLPA